jgi:hypothetical protein
MYVLRGGLAKTVLPMIWRYIAVFYRKCWKVGPVCDLVGTIDRWPKPTGIRCNMMPFVLGEQSSLPEWAQPYWPLIAKCPLPKNEQKLVGYLTIDESVVEYGKTQRRAGLHVEATLNRARGGRMHTVSRAIVSHWGAGQVMVPPTSSYEGGIYMASNMKGSTAIWMAELQAPERNLGYHGDVSHLSGFLQESGATYFVMEAGQLWWLTDMCPHEALPHLSSKKPFMRQYFRLVTSAVDVWYAANSTANPKGIVPPPWTKVVQASKFDPPGESGDL